MKTIVHVVTTLERGGAENQLSILICEQVKHGHNVIAIPLKGDPELDSEIQKSGAKVVTEIRNRPFLFQILLLREFFNKSDYLIHAHLPRAEIAVYLSSNKQEIILSRHNSEPFFPGANRFISSLLSRVVTRKAKCVICISEAVKAFCLSKKEIANGTRLQVVHYGYEEKSYSIGDSELRQLEKINRWKSEGYIVIGTLSRLEKQKNLEVLLNATSKLSKSSLKIKVVIVGKGSLKGSLQNLAKSLNIDDNVYFYGRTNSPLELIRSFDIFTLTSLYEGFGLVLLEAMAASIPIVASKNSAIPEVLGEDYKGFFTTGDSHELASVLEQIISNDTLKRELLIQLSMRQALFTPEKMERHIDSVYESSLPI